MTTTTTATKTIKLEMFVKRIVEYTAYVEVPADFEPTTENIATLVDGADWDYYGEENTTYHEDLGTINQVGVWDTETDGEMGVFGELKTGGYIEPWQGPIQK